MRRAADMIGNQIAAAMDGKAGMVVPLADRSRVQIQSRQKSAVIGDLVAAPKRQGFVNYHNSIDIFNYGSFVPKIHAKNRRMLRLGVQEGSGSSPTTRA
jgi:hypothetical protein